MPDAPVGRRAQRREAVARAIARDGHDARPWALPRHLQVFEMEQRTIALSLRTAEPNAEHVEASRIAAGRRVDLAQGATVIPPALARARAHGQGRAGPPPPRPTFSAPPPRGHRALTSATAQRKLRGTSVGV